MGDAPEQHLWELQLIQRRRGEELGVTETLALYDTPGWLNMRDDYLSTSSTPSTSVRFGGFGPTSSRCIGLAYLLLADRFDLHLSTPRSVADEMLLFVDGFARRFASWRICSPPSTLTTVKEDDDGRIRGRTRRAEQGKRPVGAADPARVRHALALIAAFWRERGREQSCGRPPVVGQRVHQVVGGDHLVRAKGANQARPDERVQGWGGVVVPFYCACAPPAGWGAPPYIDADAKAARRSFRRRGRSFVEGFAEHVSGVGPSQAAFGRWRHLSCGG